VHTFALPPFAYTPDNVAAMQRNLDSARWVLLPQAEWAAYVHAATSKSATASPDALLARQGSNELQYSIFTRFPLSVRALNPTYDPTLQVGLLLRHGWVPKRESGGYVILRRRG
jgi:hypothetical protein